MKTIHLLAFIFLSLASTPIPTPGAEATNVVSSPWAGNVGASEFPRISPDLRVTFRLKAPEAKKVQLRGGAGLVHDFLDLAKAQDGYWMVTTPPATPGFHYYWFVVDGVHVNDLGSRSFFGYGHETSGLEVPGPDAAFYQPDPATPRGDVRTRWYHSRITGRWRRAQVYTPPGYEVEASARFPVLYLLHGAGENEAGWIEQGRAPFILDHLLAAGKARPMILVIDSGYAVAADAVTRPDSAGNPFLDASKRPPAPTSAFEAVLLEELVPLVDAGFRTLPDAAHRGLAGLSMGSSQALQISLKHPDRFAWIAAMSPPPKSNFDPKSAYDGAFANPTEFNRRVRLLWLGAGTAETTFHQHARTMHEALETAGIRNVFYASPGTDHEWQTWRRSLRDLAPRLFRD